MQVSNSSRYKHSSAFLTRTFGYVSRTVVNLSRTFVCLSCTSVMLRSTKPNRSSPARVFLLSRVMLWVHLCAFLVHMWRFQYICSSLSTLDSRHCGNAFCRQTGMLLRKTRCVGKAFPVFWTRLSIWSSAKVLISLAKTAKHLKSSLSYYRYGVFAEFRVSHESIFWRWTRYIG